MAELTVRFWGVRGSLATPGLSTARYGGNTSCVEVIVGNEHLVFDMGSGLRELGTALQHQPGVHVTFFLSHYHWDHIQGLPFFKPAFVDPTAVLTIYGATRLGKSVREILAGQMINPYFPVSIGEMQAKLLFRSFESGSQVQVGSAIVSAREMAHPGGSLDYRVQTENASVVYATDFEHGTAADDVLVDFARGADMLIFDSTYTDSEYETHKGWGHSTWAMGTQIAKAAGVKKLILFHHDPSHDDDMLDAIVQQARGKFRATDAAQEKKSYTLPARGSAKATPKSKPAKATARPAKTSPAPAKAPKRPAKRATARGRPTRAAARRLTAKKR
jgi:phosphoribosyl 1,2-cyclic phosphodiesterase